MPIDLTLYALDTITDSREFEKLCSDLLFREGFKKFETTWRHARQGHRRFDSRP